jgi:integrase
MKKPKKLPKGLFWRNHILWIRYRDNQDRLVRESTGQTSIKFAEDCYRKRKTEVAERKHFPAREFDKVRFGTLLDYWWNNHAKHKSSKFIYLLPRLERFKKLKARAISSDVIQSFLFELRDKEQLSATSANHYRTILNSTFNFAIARKKFDFNPVKAVHQFPENPGRDRFSTSEELNQILTVCDREADLELKAFILIAATTGLRKGAILPRMFADLHLNEQLPYIYVGRTKNGDPIKLPLPQIVIDAIRNLPSFGREEYLFPAKPNVRYKENFSKPYMWDIGKRFRRICRLAKVSNLRIHDLRHYATTVLFIKGIPDSIISKMTGHRSRELKRYQHLSPLFRQQTVDLIARDLEEKAVTQLVAHPQLAPRHNDAKLLKKLAEPTGLEPATSDVTGRRSNQLNYDSA